MLTARQRAQQELLKAEAARIDAETPANTDDVINARYSRYSGGYQFVTANGGTVTAANTSNAAPLIGESYQLRRDRSSGAFEFAPPARVQVQAERNRYNPPAWTTATEAPDDTTNAPNRNGKGWLELPDTGDPTLHVWRQSSAEWLAIGGGMRLTYLNGDPNLFEYPWSSSEMIYDFAAERLFLPHPGGDPDGTNSQQKWMPSGNKTFEALPSTRVYTGDMYQDQSDGTLYRVNSSGSWVIQFYCPECETEPTPPDDPLNLFSFYVNPPGIETATVWIESTNRNFCDSFPPPTACG